MSRLTDDDRHFGPITYGPSSWDALRLVWASGGVEEGSPSPKKPNTLTVNAFRWTARINLPKILKPLLIKHVPESWDAATIARLGRNYYYEAFQREYGFCLSEGGFFSLYLGAQTHCSSTTQDWHYFLPWTQWRFHRMSFYDTTGAEFWTQIQKNRKRGSGLGNRWDEQRAAEEACPKISFNFRDYDGKEISVVTHIEEREWHFGTGWFKWLSWFRKPKIRRSLDLQFSEEVGPEKGSWKGGTMGHSIDMLPGELHESAFRRYCDKEQDARHGRKFRITFIGVKA